MRSVSLTLDNGMRIFIYPAKHLESVCAVVGVRYGMVDDAPRIGGTCHYLEHMIFKGTKRRSAKEIKDEATAMGAEHNATTGAESTLYYIHGYKDYVRRMLDLLADTLTNTLFSEKAFELERGPMLNERLGRLDNTMYFLYDNLTKVLYRKHPVGRVSETERTIRRITLEDVVLAYKRYYCPANMVLTIYGNVDMDVIKQLVARYFGGFHRKYVPTRRRIAREIQRGRSVTMYRRNLKRAIIGIGFKCREFEYRRTREFLALNVLMRVLSERLFDEVRERRGLSYDPVATYESYNGFAFIAAQAGAEPDKVGITKSVMLDELRKLQDGKITAEEYKRARRATSIYYTMLRENSLQMAYTTTMLTLLTGDHMFVYKMPSIMRGVRLRDVVEYARRYIDVDNCSTLILKPR